MALVGTSTNNQTPSGEENNHVGKLLLHCVHSFIQSCFQQTFSIYYVLKTILGTRDMMVIKKWSLPSRSLKGKSELYSLYSLLSKQCQGEFPAGPMVRTYAFTAKGLGQSLVGELRPSKPCGSAKKNKTNKKKNTHTQTRHQKINLFPFTLCFAEKYQLFP